jgi:hypothetical protein
MAHTFDVKNRTAVGTANPTTVSLTPTSGATVLVVGLIYSGTTDRTGGSPTFNGVAMTKAGATIKGTETSVELWYLLNPSIGTFNVSVPNANTRSMEVSAYTFKAGAGNSTTFGTTYSNFSTTGTTNPSVSTTATAGQLLVAVIGNGATTWNPSARTGVQLYDSDDGAWGGGSQYILSATANQSVGWTFGTSEDWSELIASFNEVADTNRQGYVTWAEAETPNAPRVGRVTFAELETPNAPRQSYVTFAEAEVPNAPRVGRVTWAELETGDPPVDNNRIGRILWSELETGDAPRLGRISWAELQTGDAPRTSRVTWAELEAPTAPRQSRILWAELESPTAPRAARLTWSELEAPTAPRSARITWSEIQTPDGPRRGWVLWAELEAPEVGGGPEPPGQRKKHCLQAIKINFQGQ